MTDHELKVWSFQTTKAPYVRGLQTIGRLLQRRRTQTIDQLGEELLSHLRLWLGEHTRVVLVGHSMGGLVTAAALRHLSNSADERDDALRVAIGGAVCIATPFAGATDAGHLARMYRVIGGNLHVRDLSPESTSRRTIVSGFTNKYLSGEDRLPLWLFRASDDEVVLSEEITQPFGGGTYRFDVLVGNHSRCVQNLEPLSPNFQKISAAIESMLGDVSAARRATSPFGERLAVEMQSHTSVRYDLPNGLVINWVGEDGTDAARFGRAVLDSMSSDEPFGGVR